MKKKAFTAVTALLLAVFSCTLLSSRSVYAGSPVSFETAAPSAFAEAFLNPTADNRPLIRWWVPGSMMDKEEVKAEIESMADAGFGGAEIVPVSMGGGDDFNGSVDWGSDSWKEITKYILETAGENNFTIDFTMTPAWPLALPTVTDVNNPAQGAQMELDGAFVDGITNMNPFNGVLPVSEEAFSDSEKVGGKIILAGVSTAKYADKENNVLAYDSARSFDLESEVTDNGDGTYSFSFTPEDDGEYVICAWYMHPSGNQKYGNNQIDHYSLAGSRMIIDYWENELIPYYGEAFKNCRSLFIDSLEFATHLDWTYGLAESFEEKNGYDLIKVLPAIYDGSGNWSSIGNVMGDPVPSFTFDQNTKEVINDFKEHLTQTYIENHIKPLREFCRRNGVTLRYQTSYGKSLNLGETALYPDIPETESLYGNDYVDFYRMQAGAVHAAGKKIFSIEAAAEYTDTWNPINDSGEYASRGNGNMSSGNYEQTFLDHIWHDQRAFAGGVNQVVFHGYPYKGVYNGIALDGLQWPGFTGFESSSWSNSWGERQPNWMFAGTYLNFLTRNQYVLRQGSPKIDAAVYRHSYYETIDFWQPETAFPTSVLEHNGYSYDFIDPSLFEMERMTVENGVLDPKGSAYKVLIFNNQETLPYSFAEKLVSFAEKGLPVIFIGNVPTEKAYTKDEEITALMETLMAMENVRFVDAIENTLDAMNELGISASASYDSETLLATHRNDKTADYYFLYNDGGAKNFREIETAADVSATVTLEGNGTPYILNAWDGSVDPIADYTANDGKVTFDITLAPNDSRIIVVTEKVLTSRNDRESMSETVTVSDWDLVIESWIPGATVLETDKVSVDVGNLLSLNTWKELSEDYTYLSGVGTYTASFTMPESWQEGQKAVIQLGEIKDAFALEINGTNVTVDQVSGKADVTTVLQPGENTIKVTVATSLLNALLKNNESILRDDGSVLDGRAPSGYGMTGTVTICGN